MSFKLIRGSCNSGYTRDYCVNQKTEYIIKYNFDFKNVCKIIILINNKNEKKKYYIYKNDDYIKFIPTSKKINISILFQNYGNNKEIIVNKFDLFKNQIKINWISEKMLNNSIKLKNINYCLKKQKVLFFTDSDKDDIYSLTILVSQCYLNGIEILGIVCDDGFLSYPQNISIVQFWLNNILNYTGLDIYLGRPRNDYLKQQRYFPDSFITSYINVMVTNFGYNPSVIPTYKNLDELTLKINNEDSNSISVLTTGNMTTFSYLLLSNPKFKSKIKNIFSMIGNYNVSGNVLPDDLLQPNILPNSEYNAYLDPDSFSNVVRINKTKLNLVPVDSTNYAPLTNDTITHLQSIGTSYYNNCQDDFVKNIYNNFIKLLQSTLITKNTKLYMWDLVATILFLKNSISQTYITPSIDILWTGKINTNTIENNQKVILYNYCNYDELLQAIIKSIFIQNLHF